MRRLQDILDSNSTSSGPSLPLVHTTASFYMQSILDKGKIEPRECDVYIGEKLSYFFVGRPAYKALGRDIMHWELPSCLILDFSVLKPLRTYPFDTGAYKKGFIPSYTTMHDISEFSIDSETGGIEKYIGTFFGSTDNYFRGKPVSKDDFLRKHDILPTETSIHAILSLISGNRIAKELDERRSAIECQFDSEIPLEGDVNPLAVILPEVYLEDKLFIKEIEDRRIDIITYPIFPINNEFFYFAIYERCYNFFKKRKYI